MQQVKDIPIKKFKIGEEPTPAEDEAHLSASQRMNMVWPITKAAWGLKNGQLPSAGSARHFGRVIRGKS